MAEVVQNQGAGTKDLTGPAQTYNRHKQNNKRRQSLKSDNCLNMISELPRYGYLATCGLRKMLHAIK